MSLFIERLKYFTLLLFNLLYEKMEFFLEKEYLIHCFFYFTIKKLFIPSDDFADIS